MVYAKEVETTDQRFKGRDVVVSSQADVAVIPVPDTEVLCNGCNRNIYPERGFLVYLNECELKYDLPYDLYCDSCLKKYFPKANIVKEV